MEEYREIFVGLDFTKATARSDISGLLLQIWHRCAAWFASWGGLEFDCAFAMRLVRRATG